MNRYLIVLLLSCLSILSGTSRASIIPVENYITYDQNNDGVADYDIVWVSSWAFQFYGCNTSGGSIPNQENYLTELYSGSVVCENQMFAPDYLNDGWMFFEQIDGLDVSLVVDLFNDAKFNDLSDSGYINAFSYWNTTTDLTAMIAQINSFSFSAISDWTQLSPIGANPFQTGDEYYSNVFYVRESQPVPEPSTLLIFAIGLIGLAARLRTAK
jgi:hypothetical protein